MLGDPYLLQTFFLPHVRDIRNLRYIYVVITKIRLFKYIEIFLQTNKKKKKKRKKKRKIFR